MIGFLLVLVNKQATKSKGLIAQDCKSLGVGWAKGEDAQSIIDFSNYSFLETGQREEKEQGREKEKSKEKKRKVKKRKKKDNGRKEEKRKKKRRKSMAAI